MFWEKLPTVTPELGSCDPAGLSARKGGELRTQCNSGQDVLPKEERRARKGDLKTSDDLATLYLGPVSVCVWEGSSVAKHPRVPLARLPVFEKQQ